MSKCVSEELIRIKIIRIKIIGVQSYFSGWNSLKYLVVMEINNRTFNKIQNSVRFSVRNPVQNSIHFPRDFSMVIQNLI